MTGLHGDLPGALRASELRIVDVEANDVWVVDSWTSSL